MDTPGQLRRPLVEVCVGSLSDAIAAAAAGADRLELCSATEVGGLTPSAGLLERVIATIDLPVVCMIRPRAGGFCYSREDFATAVLDAQRAMEHGARGIAFGFLFADGQIDEGRCREFVQIAGEGQSVFHRAFDFVPDALASADVLVELGVTRVLTSGQQPTAIEGATLIRSIRERTNGLLEVMPGGGICAADVCELLQQTRCRQIHVGAARPVCDGSTNRNASLRLSTPSFDAVECYRAVQHSLVAEIVEKLEADDITFSLNKR